MSVNRNILKSYSNPVLEPNQIPVELVTNVGSRWVMLDWPVKTYLTSSEGGDCEGITVQWSTDDRFASEPDNYYTNITSSVLSCNSSSLLPLTSSIGWSIYINSTYDFQPYVPNTPPTTATGSIYYIRSFQNVTGGGRGPYSNVLSIDTRAPNVYNNGTVSMGLLKARVTGSAPVYKAGTTGSLVIFTTDSYNPTSSNLQAWSATSITGNGAIWTPTTNVAVTASITGSGAYIVKNEGPNYDAIVTNGATWSFQLYGSPSASLRETNAINNGEFSPDTTSSIALVGIISGSMQIVGESFEMTVYATTSSVKIPIAGGFQREGAVTTQYGKFAMDAGYNTINRPLGCYTTEFIIGGTTEGGYLEPVGTAQTASASNRTLGSQVTINTSPDCIFTGIYLGVRPDVTQYRLQYGQIGAQPY
jgi:hypothetical protein